MKQLRVNEEGRLVTACPLSGTAMSSLNSAISAQLLRRNSSLGCLQRDGATEKHS